MDDIYLSVPLLWTVVKNGNTFLYNTGPITSLKDPDLECSAVLFRLSAGLWQPATGMP